MLGHMVGGELGSDDFESRPTLCFRLMLWAKFQFNLLRLDYAFNFNE